MAIYRWARKAYHMGKRTTSYGILPKPMWWTNIHFFSFLKHTRFMHLRLIMISNMNRTSNGHWYSFDLRSQWCTYSSVHQASISLLLERMNWLGIVAFTAHILTSQQTYCSALNKKTSNAIRLGDVGFLYNCPEIKDKQCSHHLNDPDTLWLRTLFTLIQLAPLKKNCPLASLYGGRQGLALSSKDIN